MSKYIDFYQFQRKFSTDMRCYKYLLAQRWPNGFICPRCQHTEYSFHTTRKLFQCKKCRYQASVTAGTIFHRTKTPLKKWFWIIFLISRNKTGYSIHYLMRLLEFTCYKTVWTIHHKIHQAMSEREAKYKLAGLIELDDSYFGQKNVSGKRGRGAGGKSTVMVGVAMRKVQGKIKPSFVKMQVSDNIKKISVEEFIKENIMPNSTINTDRYKSYLFLKNTNYQHNPIKIYNPKQTIELLPWVHILIGNVKGILKGVHHGVSPKHLQRFLVEFCYRFNRRFIEKRMFSNLILACVNTKTITLAELRA